MRRGERRSKGFDQYINSRREREIESIRETVSPPHLYDLMDPRGAVGLPLPQSTYHLIPDQRGEMNIRRDIGIL